MPALPKEEGPIRRNKPPQKELIKSDGKLYGFELPEKVLGTNKNGRFIKWHPMTKKWWDHWRRSPQATKMLSEPDWDFLLDTALMHHTMWASRKWEFASEIRLRVQKFGCTPEDRLRLRLEIDNQRAEAEVGNHKGADVASLDARRRRMAQG